MFFQRGEQSPANSAALMLRKDEQLGNKEEILFGIGIDITKHAADDTVSLNGSQPECAVILQYRLDPAL